MDNGVTQDRGRDSMMMAAQQLTFGGPEVLHEAEIPRPSPGISEILVKVHAAGVNPTDWKHRASQRFLGEVGEAPYILGWDVSGTVVKVGPGVTIFKPGDDVFGMLPYPQGAGSHAEYVVGPARAFARKPASIDHVHAGAVPLAALTGWQALVDTADAGPGDRVLIHGAAGGVGHLAVQIAKARGAYVIGTASSAKHDLVRGLGANEVIDYRENDLVTRVRDIDIVLDTVGGATQLQSLQVLRRGGVLVSTAPVAAEGLLEQASARGIRVELIFVEADRAGMLAIADMLESGEMRPIIAETFPLSQAANAHRMGETNRTTGKIVLVMDSGSGPGVSAASSKDRSELD